MLIFVSVRVASSVFVLDTLEGMVCTLATALPHLLP